MTTAYKSQQSPRLPINHPEHVARILERAERVKRERRGERIIIWAFIASVAVIIACIFYST